MKTHKQASEALTHLADKLKGQRVAMLTLTESGTGLSSRPMTPLEMDAQGAFWMMSSHAVMQPLIGSGVPANLAFMDHGDGDYVSVAGRAELVDDLVRKQALWTMVGRAWFKGPDDPDLTLVRVTPHQAEIWDGPDNAATRVLALAASVVAGREVGMGTKETIDLPAGGA
jgi:general stress protein 26